MPVTHVFLVDVGHAAVASGATAAACMCIEQVLDAVQGATTALATDERVGGQTALVLWDAGRQLQKPRIAVGCKRREGLLQEE